MVFCFESMSMASQWLYTPTNHTKRTPVHRVWGICVSAYRQHLWEELIKTKYPLIGTENLWNCMSHDQRDQGHIPQKYEVIFESFRLMKNIIFNKTKSFVGRKTSDHTCQILCSKSNCETMYHWLFLLVIAVFKIMNNLNVCSALSYLYPWSRFKAIPMKYNSNKIIKKHK
jgi:hypothetical protein